MPRTCRERFAYCRDVPRCVAKRRKTRNHVRLDYVSRRAGACLDTPTLVAMVPASRDMNMIFVLQDNYEAIF